MPSPSLSVDAPVMEEDTAKIRKRGCSPSSSASSILHNYRFKKTLLVGKRGGRSTTPVPTWRIMASRSPSISVQISAAGTPRSHSGRSTASRASQIPQPVSARKLAATFWGLNQVTSPAPEHERRRRRGRDGKPSDSDPSHSPFSERSVQSEACTLHGTRKSDSNPRRLSNKTSSASVLDSISNGSLMETESRSSTGFRSRLKDVNSALTTSKELLKIISRVWGQEDHQPSSSKSLISALHAELERAKLQVKCLLQEKQSDQAEVDHLLKCFMEEKAAWKMKEKEKIKAAVEPIAGELELERKMRKRSESFNNKLGKELERTKMLLASALKGLDSGKVEDAAKFDDDSDESDLQSIELNIKRMTKGCKSVLRSTPLLRSASDALERVAEHEKYGEYGKEAHRRSCGDDLLRHKTVKGLRDYQTRSNSRLGFDREVGSPARDWSESRSRDLVRDRSVTAEEGGKNEGRFDSRIGRRSRGRADFVHL